MPHFLIDENKISNEIIIVDDVETIKHLACALRAKEGEILKFIDKNKVQYQAEIIEISKKNLRARILSKEISKRELQYKIYVAQSVLKTEAEALFISNAAQLGLKGLYPFISDFSTVKADFVKGKGEKWQKISDEAFKQCERADIMRVFELSNLTEIIKKFKKENIIVLAEREENTNIKGAVKSINIEEEILVIIGPEGGFSEKEFEFFKKEGFKLATIGNLIFKAPNALTAGLSNLIFALDLKKGGQIG